MFCNLFAPREVSSFHYDYPRNFPLREERTTCECQVFITIIGSTLRPLAIATGIKVKRRSYDFVGKTFLVRALQWKCTRIEFHWSTRTPALSSLSLSLFLSPSQNQVFFSGTDLFTRQSAEISCAERLLRNSIPIEVYGLRETCNDIRDDEGLKREDTVETGHASFTYCIFSTIPRLGSIDRER